MKSDVQGNSTLGRCSKLRNKILGGGSDANIDFAALCQLLVRLGFAERVKGGHHIFVRDDAEEILNLQPKDGKAKAYQVRQVRGMLVKYRLGEPDVD
ncbi:MAG: type II toxin-antitoxin system HicA family toxin [Chromatiales bacterium]